MIIGNKNFDTENNTYIMGILNVTPDSFSDGGKYNLTENALAHTEQMLKEGADIIDVGGESTRPGYIKVTVEEEIDRVTSIIEKIRKNFDTIISIDTYKPDVAKAAIEAGADLVNDIWGLKYDERMAHIIADNKVACCLMHNRKPDAIPYPDDVTGTVINELKETVDIALKAGIEKNRIMLDPGICFAKTLEDNLKIMNGLERLQELSYPVLLGTSKKSMIGLTLDLDINNRGEGTIATSVIGVMKGCSFFRVHDVKENKRAIDMTRAILNSCN